MVCLTEYNAASIFSPASRSMLVKRPSFSLAVRERVLKKIGLGGIISPSNPPSRVSSSWLASYRASSLVRQIVPARAEILRASFSLTESL